MCEERHAASLAPVRPGVRTFCRTPTCPGTLLSAPGALRTRGKERPPQCGGAEAALCPGLAPGAGKQQHWKQCGSEQTLLLQTQPSPTELPRPQCNKKTRRFVNTEQHVTSPRPVIPAQLLFDITGISLPRQRCISPGQDQVGMECGIFFCNSRAP